ncbi:MAG: hypothetical protein Q9227_004430 [Pyrenula ochraceoflavens]
MAARSELYARLAECLSSYRNGTSADSQVLWDVKMDLQRQPGLQYVLPVIKECLETIELTGQKDLDPSIVPEIADLAKQAICDPSFSFDHVQELITLDRIGLALQSSLDLVVDLALDCLQKATVRLSDANIVGGKVGLTEEIIIVWLSNANTAISTRAADILLDLLKTEIEASPKNLSANVTKLTERRVFQDPAAYRLLFRYTSDVLFDRDRYPDRASWLECPLDRSRRSIAQGRLFDFVVALGKISFPLVADSHLPDIELSFRRKPRSSPSSLLDFVTHDMTDADDPLVLRVRMDFCTSLLGIKPLVDGIETAISPPTLSNGLKFLIESGVHNDIIRLYVKPEKELQDPVTASLLGDADINYLSSYFSLHPRHALEPEFKDIHHNILQRILSKLETLPFSKWTTQEGRAPHDLNILKEMPLPMLVTEPGMAAVCAIPVNPPNPLALRTLARIFHGPETAQRGVESFSQEEEGAQPEIDIIRAAGSRANFYKYITEHPDFWANLAAAIVVVSIPDATKQAIDLAWSIACARWIELPSDMPIGTHAWPLPTEPVLRSKLRTRPFRTGMTTLLALGPEVWEALLMRVEMPRVAPTADASSIVYDIQVMKEKVLTDILEEMKQDTGKMECETGLWESSFSELEQTLRDWRANPGRRNLEVKTLEL